MTQVFRNVWRGKLLSEMLSDTEMARGGINCARVSAIKVCNGEAISLTDKRENLKLSFVVISHDELGKFQTFNSSDFVELQCVFPFRRYRSNGRSI